MLLRRSLIGTLIGSICTLGFLCILIGACRTDGPDTTTSEATTDTAMTASGDTSTAGPDSPTAPKAPPPAPAPGTARVRAEIVSCDPATLPVRCQVRVESVLGYGASTPPLSTGEHTLALAPSLLDDRDGTAFDTLGTRTFVFEHAGDRPDFGNRSGNEKPPEWTIQSIE